MNPHVTDELPRLLSGEATHDAVLSSAAHLRSCPDCYEELVSALVAHASLSSAHRFAPEVVARDTADLFVGRHSNDSDEDGPLPDLSSVFAQARADAESPAAKAKAKARSAVHRTHESKRTRYLVAAVAAAVLVGGGAGAVALTDGGSDSPATHQVALKAFGFGRGYGVATMSSDGRLTIDAEALKHVTGQRYEVWLTDATRSSMQPVGWLDANGKASLSVPTDLVGTYSYVEVSQQRVAAPYTYSGVSVLRGRYTA